MERREALKALAGIAGAAGMSVTPVTVGDAQGAALVVLKSKQHLSAEQHQRIRDTWTAVVEGTALEHVRCVVLDADLAFELVKA